MVCCMKKKELVATILSEHFAGSKNFVDFVGNVGSAYAPSNIALCKYWGKDDEELNIPKTNSLSISLGNKGAFTEIKIINSKQDKVELNNEIVSRESDFYSRLINFLDLFRPNNDFRFSVKTKVNIPVAAGVASSACGFAACVLALNDLFKWNLSEDRLSILARIGSGSASRSIWHGFVEWQNNLDTVGLNEHLGFRSFAKKLDIEWPDLRVGLMLLDKNKKKISSKVAMKQSVDTSPFYKLWPHEVEKSIQLIKKALFNKDFISLGETAEQNSIAMHAIMHTTKPSIVYANSKTIELMHKIWELRGKENLNVYFTQDAGPNLKLLFLESDTKKVLKHFPYIEIVEPFSSNGINE